MSACDQQISTPFQNLLVNTNSEDLLWLVKLCALSLCAPVENSYFTWSTSFLRTAITLENFFRINKDYDISVDGLYGLYEAKLSLHFLYSYHSIFYYLFQILKLLIMTIYQFLSLSLNTCQIIWCIHWGHTYKFNLQYASY